MNNKQKLEIIHLCKKLGTMDDNLLKYWCNYTGNSEQYFDSNIKMRFYLPKLIQICSECCSPTEFQNYIFNSYIEMIIPSKVGYWCSIILNLEKTKYQKYHNDN